MKNQWWYSSETVSKAPVDETNEQELDKSDNIPTPKSEKSITIGQIGILKFIPRYFLFFISIFIIGREATILYFMLWFVVIVGYYVTIESGNTFDMVLVVILGVILIVIVGIISVVAFWVTKDDFKLDEETDK